MVGKVFKQGLKASLAILASLAIPGQAFGWSEKTHQTTGAIAWMDLADRDGQDLNELLALARHHPDYPRFAPFAAHLTPQMQDRALFEWLARWPDDIRDGPEDQPEWHYELRVVSGRSWLWPFTNGNASGGFAFNYARLANPCAPVSARAKAIGWLIHIVGDIQQPLHAGHQMTGDYSLTDRAGELAFVHRTQGDLPTNLHYYWDEMLEKGGAVLPSDADNWASALYAQWPRAELPELRRRGSYADLFALNLDETASLSELVAYQGSYLMASPDPLQAPVVTGRENAIALALVKRRVVTGGYRIADVLASALAEARARQGFCPVQS